MSSPVLVSRRGRLLFAENQVFGRRAVQNMRVVSEACSTGGLIKLDDELRCALASLRDKVLQGAPRKVVAASRTKYLVFADAFQQSLVGGVGGMTYGPNATMYHWFSCPLSCDQIAAVNLEGKATVIYELEVMAAVLAVVTLGSSWKSSDVILFCDNEAALAALITGKSDSAFIRYMLGILTSGKRSAMFACGARGFPATQTLQTLLPVVSSRA